jgi:hypothetical protein
VPAIADMKFFRTVSRVPKSFTIYTLRMKYL